MTDIVERLREYEEHRPVYDCNGLAWGLEKTDMHQAADEIERLREESAGLYRLCQKRFEEISSLREENERLSKDAERYRWLRARLYGADFDYGEKGVDESISVVMFKWPSGASIGADLDAAIGAAMEQK